MNCRFLRVLTFSAVVGLLTWVALAEGAEKEKEKEKDKVKITGIQRVWGETDKKISHMEGDLLIVQGELRIRTRYADIDQDKKEARFTQGVHLEKKDLVIDGDEFTINFKKKQGTFTGNVRLERAETKDETGKTKDHFRLKCNRLDVDTDKQNFTALGSTVLEHKEFNGTGERVEYDNASQVLVLKEQVVLVRKAEENLAGGKVRIDLSKKSFEVVDGAELTFDVDKDETKEKAEDTEKAEPGADTPEEDSEDAPKTDGEESKETSPPSGDSKGK